ncbi:ArsR/SmtB family transcription factor [Paenibacillus sp. MMO-58]|uniref:ArsR/SmtB family transcription factor n=1 Tax=Paenibacillus sp. MMO-58 TaxID=3081290 RepID=UPI0030197A54
MLSEKIKDTCDVFCFDEQKVRRLQQTLQKQNIEGMFKMFKLLGDETRMKIAFVLCEEEELCVCDVANIIGSSMATASHHLRTLKQLELAKHRKEGKMMFYSLVDDHIRQLIQLAATHSKEMITNG